MLSIFNMHRTFVNTLIIFTTIYIYIYMTHTHEHTCTKYIVRIQSISYMYI